MTIYRRLWTATLALTAGLGFAEAVLATETGTTISAALLGGTLAGLSHLSFRAAQQNPARPALYRRAAAASVVGGAGCLAFAGLAALFGSGSLLLVATIAATSPLTLQYAARRVQQVRVWLDHDHSHEHVETTPTAHPAPQNTADTAAAPPTTVAAALLPAAAALTTLSDLELCWAWRASFTALERLETSATTTRLQLVTIRQHYLDELERRNPTGFRRWLYRGARPASDPSRYINALNQ